MNMALRLLSLCLAFLTAKGSSMVAENVTVMEGETLVLNCTVDSGDRSHLEWKNPRGFVVFFNNMKALRDKRYKIATWSPSEFTVTLSNVTTGDGGLYKCLHYIHPVTTKAVNVTVIGRPALEMREDKGRKIIKCTAEASYSPYRISWLIEGGLELDTYSQDHCDEKTAKCTSMGTLVIRSQKSRVTVECIVRHEALNNAQPYLKASLTVEKSYDKGLLSTSTVGYSTSTEATAATLSETATVLSSSTETEEKGLSSTSTEEYSMGSSPPSVLTQETITRLPETATTALSTDFTSTSNHQTPETDIHEITRNYTYTAATNETYTSSVPAATELAEGNATTNSSVEAEGHDGARRSKNGTMLIVLVTVLIACLLVVVLFFVTKLKKAHAQWKKENEDWDQSLESNKSKSSNDDKGQERKNGQVPYNTTFMKYTVEVHTEMEKDTEQAAPQILETSKQPEEPAPAAGLDTVRETAV
nr:PREDICTED: cytotoxic and regulatory T-cell molecule [Lepisosteus oculatus]